MRVITPAELPSRPNAAIDPTTLETVRAILDDIEVRGEIAASEYARRFGDGDPVFHGRDELAAAARELPAEQLALLTRTAERIRKFAEAQRGCLKDLEFPIAGGFAGHTCVPVASVGCYAPGGRFPLPSSVLMTAITARVASVKSVFVASPRPTAVTLAAAGIAGADGLLAIGGAQAIAAFSRGLFGLPPCDMIVGPGNRYVTAAKQLVSHFVGIDMLAGPSELAVIADESADPRVIAADLLAQAEHDVDAVVTLISTSRFLIEAVEVELERQLQTLETKSVAAEALKNGCAVLVGNIDEAVLVCDRIGPEHLEIMTRDAEAVARKGRSAGAIFVGAGAAEVLGDYGAGPNHVLPTGSTSRFRAGLSVFSFLRCRTWMRIDRPREAVGLAQDAAALAGLESLLGHKRAAELRTLL